MERKKAASVVRCIGMVIMILLTLTQLAPSLELASISVWIGLASFFIVEGIAGESKKQSGLRFSTMGKELRAGSVWAMIGLLALIQIVSVVVGNIVFGHAFIDYDMGRTFDVLNSESISRLLALVPISAWGEEIAWRGFFLGKKSEKIPFWIWAVFSSVLFAIGHVSQHALPIVLYGTGFNFLCSLILCRLFQKTNNCMISTIGHILGNYAEIVFILMVFWK